MKLTLLLLVALAAGAIIYPRYAEGTHTVCAAFEHKLNAVAQLQLGEQAATLPDAVTRDPRAVGVLHFLQGAISASRGQLAAAYIRDRYPNLPPLAGCLAGYWKLTFDPNLTQYLHGVLKRAP